MKTLIFFLACTAFFSVRAQQMQELTFTETTHNFGTIKELDGPTEYKFEFTNTSTQPITIANVRPSCGCTSSGWTREEIAPGGEGYISAVYNPLNRPGPFHKTLTVTTTGQQKTIVLRISGQVEPKPRTIEDDFPTVMGGLRVKYRALNMGRILDNGPTDKEFQVYNMSDKPIVFQPDVEAPAYITVTFAPEELQPAEKGFIKVVYDASKKNDLGFMSDNIVFYTNEEGDNNRKSFSVYADVNEYFPPLTPEAMAMAPRLLIEDKVFDFGRIKQGEVVVTEFNFTNDGKSVLNFRKTKSSCGCTVIDMPKMDLEPGESMLIKVSFDAKGRRGIQQKSVTLYTNDPVTPVQRVTVKAIVELPAAN
jgi:hypothetical protein